MKGCNMPKLKIENIKKKDIKNNLHEPETPTKKQNNIDGRSLRRKSEPIKQTNLSLPESFKNHLIKLSRELNMTMSEVVMFAIKNSEDLFDKMIKDENDKI
jgi:hypothetical protein